VEVWVQLHTSLWGIYDVKNGAEMDFF